MANGYRVDSLAGEESYSALCASCRRNGLRRAPPHAYVAREDFDRPPAAMTYPLAPPVPHHDQQVGSTCHGLLEASTELQC